MYKKIIVLLKNGATVELPDLNCQNSIKEYKNYMGITDIQFQKFCKMVLENKAEI